MHCRILGSFICAALFLTQLLAAQTPSSATNAPSPNTTSSSYRILTQDAVIDQLKQFSGGDQQREERLKGWFAKAGCRVSQLSEQKLEGGLPPNLICEIPGQTDRVILVSAHYDYVKKGEGVVDNWSGASLLPNFLSTILQAPRRYTYMMVAFAGEEKGLAGSEYFVQHLTAAERDRIRAVINLDTLGLGPTEVWVSHSDPELVSILAGVARALNLPIHAVNVDRLGSTDSESFAKYKVPRITIHSLTQDTLHVLHSPDDRFEAIQIHDYYDTYRLLSAYLLYLDQSLPVSTTAPTTK